MQKQEDQKLKMQSMLTVCFTGFYTLPPGTNKVGRTPKLRIREVVEKFGEVYLISDNKYSSV